MSIRMLYTYTDHHLHVEGSFNMRQKRLQRSQMLHLSYDSQSYHKTLNLPEVLDEPAILIWVKRENLGSNITISIFHLLFIVQRNTNYAHKI